MDSLEAKAIPGTEGAFCTPFFSADGQWLAFFSTGKLKKVSLHGGPPVTLANAVSIHGVTWGPDDSVIFSDPNVGGLLKVSASGGTPQVVTTVDASKGETGHRWPVLLPGGNALLFAVLRAGGPDDAQIVVQRLDTGERKVLVDGGTYPSYVPTGHVVYVRAGAMMAVPFDPGRLEVTGPPLAVADDIRQSGNGAAQFSLSNQGSLVYVPGGTRGNEHTLAWVDRKGKAQALAAPAGGYVFPKLSPDGNRVLMQGGATDNDLLLYDISRNVLTRLTFGGKNQFGTWSPNGEWIAYSSSGPGAPLNLFRRPADGIGSEERLTNSKNIQSESSWSPDGKLLAFMENDPSTGFDIWLLPLEGDPSTGSGQSRKPRPFLRTPYQEHIPSFSPDGRWLAYVSDESGRAEVYVRPVSGQGEKWQVSTAGGTEPAWVLNGRELFYRDQSGRKMMVVDVTLQPSFAAGKPRVLFEDPYMGQINGRNYDVAPDGQRFLMVQPSEQPATQVNVVLNWFEDLKRRVPVQ